MTDAVKPVYAPLPARALVDRRLSERHLRTLAVVAAHDRLGANGTGCWASHQRLAAMVGCAYARLSMNLSELGEFGYIERRRHPLNGNLRVYRVIYAEADAATMRSIKADADSSPIGKPTGTSPHGEQLTTSRDGEQDGSPDGEDWPPDTSPNRKQSSANTSPSGEGEPPNSSPSRAPNPHESVGKTGVNIFREAGNTSRGNDEIHSPEGAPSCDGAALPRRSEEIAVYLRQLESRLDGQCRDDRERDLATLHALLDELDLTDPLRGWAYRLVEHKAFYPGEEIEETADASPPSQDGLRTALVKVLSRQPRRKGERPVGVIAEAAGISIGQLSNFKSGRKGLSREAAARLAAVLEREAA